MTITILTEIAAALNILKLFRHGERKKSESDKCMEADSNARTLADKDVAQMRIDLSKDVISLGRIEGPEYKQKREKEIDAYWKERYDFHLKNQLDKDKTK